MWYEFGASSGPYSPELNAIIARANLEGFSLPATTQLISCNNLINAYKTAGVWNKMDRLYNFAYNNAPNLVKYSQEFDNVAWTKSNINVTANATAAPDITVTADKIFENAALNTHVVSQTFPGYSSTIYTMSFYLKAAEKTQAVVNFSDGVLGMIRTFTLTGAGSVDVSTGTTITNVGSGWYYCVMTRTTSVSATVLTPQFYTALGSYLGDGVSGYYVWGVQIEKAAAPTAYYKTPNTHLINFARIDWKNPATSPLITLNGGMTFVEQGYMGNGVDAYADTGFIPSTHGINYTLNNASRGGMVYTSPTVGNVIDGNTTVVNNAMFNTNSTQHRINTTNTLTPSAANLGGAGWKSFNRDNSTDVRFYNRTTEILRNATSTVLPANSQIMFRNTTVYSNTVLANYMMGASITSTENLAIRNDFNTYLFDIGLTPNTTA